MEERLAGVPSTQSVRYIVDEVHGVFLRVHMKEGRGASNSSKDTLGPDALDFFKNMYKSKSNIAASSEPSYGNS